MSTRYPSNIGFYPGAPESLTRQIEACMRKAYPESPPQPFKGDHHSPRRIVAGISPHAGYVFSGSTTAKMMGALVADGKPETFILLGLLHRGPPITAIMTKGDWSMPLGKIPIDTQLANTVLGESTTMVENIEAHRREHSIEVQLPFLQYLYGSCPIVPIGIGVQDLDDLRDVASAIVAGVKALNRDAVLIASSDMTHFGGAYNYAPITSSSIEEILNFMRSTDGDAIQCIEQLEPERLLSTVVERGITMCGVAPVTTALLAAKALGAKTVQSLQYTTSYEEYGGSADQIVGYYSAIIQR